MVSQPPPAGLWVLTHQGGRVEGEGTLSGGQSWQPSPAQLCACFQNNNACSWHHPPNHMDKIAQEKWICPQRRKWKQKKLGTLSEWSDEGCYWLHNLLDEASYLREEEFCHLGFQNHTMKRLRQGSGALLRNLRIIVTAKLKGKGAAWSRSGWGGKLHWLKISFNFLNSAGGIYDLQSISADDKFFANSSN